MSQIKNDNIFVRAPKPIDGRTTLNTGAFYDTVADFLADTSVTPYRFISMTVPFVIAGDQVEYWFVNGVEDVDFQLKLSSAPSVPNLQQVTTGIGNNITPNIAHFTGEDNFSAATDGLAISGTSIGYRKTSANIGALVFSDNTVLLRKQGGGQVVFQVENGLSAGTNFNSRASGSDAVNLGEFTTLGQVGAIIAGQALQQVTDHGNYTNKALQITDFNALDLTKDGMALLGGSTAISLGFIKSGAIPTAISLTTETPTQAGVSTGSRVSGVAAINPTELTTLSQVQGLIPSVTGFELLANKSINLTSPNNTKYPSTLAVSTAIGTGSTIGADTTGNSATTAAMTVFGASSTILATNLGSSAVRLSATDSKVVDITGNAETVTNGVYTTGSYADPSWITSLGYSKLTGAPNLSVYELLANKQNSLATDGTGVKYPTVDAVNNNLFDTTKKWVLFGDSFSDTLLPSDYPYYVLQALHLTGTVTHAVGGNQINDQLTIMNSLLASNANYFQNFDLVSILVGVNDFAGSTAIGNRSSLISDNNYAGKLKSMIQNILNSNPDIDIFLMTPTEANSALVPYGSTNSAGWSLKELSVLIGQIASDYAIQCIDLYSLSNFNLQTIPSLTTDLLHPNVTGLKYISEAVISGFKTKNNAGKNIDLGLNKYITNNFPIFKDKSIEPSLLYQNTNNLGWNTLASYSLFGLNVNGSGADKMLTIGDFVTASNRSDIYIRSTSDARIYSGGGDLSLGASDGARDVTLLQNGNFGVGTISAARNFVVSNGGAQGLEFRGWDGSGSADIFAYNRSTSATIPMSFNASSFIFGIGDVTMNNITSTSFIKSGGTSSHFLKADGTVDATVYAPLASPALTGTPTAPTPTAGTNTTQIATTAFTQSEIAAYANALTVTDATAVSYTKTTLNSTYPTAPILFKVVCPTIGTVYQKYDSTNWFSQAIVILP